MSATTEPTPTTNPAVCKDDQFKLLKAAVAHVLNALADDPRKFWLMGDMTGSYEKLTAAAAAVWGIPQEQVQNDFRPRSDVWARYLKEKEAEERLLTHCRENGITAPEK